MSVNNESTTESNEEVQAGNGAPNSEAAVKDHKSASAKEETLDADEINAEESETTAQADEQQKKKEGKGFKKRIDGLRAERDHWKAEALKAAKVAEPKVEAKPVESKSEGKPKAENFDSHEEYVEAVAEWVADTRDAKKAAKAKEEAVKSEQQKKMESYAKRVSSFKEAHEDFDDVIEEFTAGGHMMSVAVDTAIVESDIGPELLYYLAQNTEELDRINKMDFGSAQRAIGRIEARLAKTESSQEKIEPKKTTKAPPPIAPIGGKTTSSTLKPLHEISSYAEYEKRRRQELKQKR